MIKKTLLFLTIFLLLFLSLYLEDVEVIKNPKPTHFEKKFIPLKEVNSLNYDIDDENFIARAGSVAIDKNDNLFVYDFKQFKIFKFDKDLKFIKAFGFKGRGPGEFGASLNSVEPYIGFDNKLYIADTFNQKIHLFDLNGQFIKDYPVDYTKRFLPIISIAGDFIIPSSDDQTILSIYSKKMELKQTLLKRDELRRFLFYKPKGHLMIKYLISPTYKMSLFYQVFPDNKLIIILSNDMTYFLFKDLKLIKKVKILPEIAIQVFKRDYLESIRNEEDAFMRFVTHCFIDPDDFNYFYLQFPKDKLNNRIPLYKFSLAGTLIKVFYIKGTSIDEYPKFLLKKNDLFYVEGSEKIFLYKE